MTDQQATAPDWSRFHGAMVSGTMQGEILSACERAWAWLELPAEDCARRIEKHQGLGGERPVRILREGAVSRERLAEMLGDLLEPADPDAPMPGDGGGRPADQPA